MRVSALIGTSVNTAQSGPVLVGVIIGKGQITSAIHGMVSNAGPLHPLTVTIRRMYWRGTAPAAIAIALALDPSRVNAALFHTVEARP